MLLSVLASLAFLSPKQTLHGEEFFVRTDPTISVERLADAIRPFGSIESRTERTRCFLIRLRPGIKDDFVRRRLVLIKGLHLLTAEEEPVDMNSMRSLTRKIRHLTDEEGDKAAAGADYLESYRYMVGRRAFPNDSFDWGSLEEARKHVAKMPVGKLRTNPHNPAPTNNAFWQFLGPTDLQIPPYPALDFGLPPVNGRVNAVAFDPNHTQTIYAGGAQGGLWRSVDFGVTWTWLSSSWTELAVNCIVVDPKDSNTIYVGRGDYHGHIVGSFGIMKTTDGGITWTEIATATMGNVGVDSILMDPTNDQVLIAGSGDQRYYGGLYLSKDAGKTWTLLQGNNEDDEWPSLAASLPVNGKTRFYAVKSGKASSSGAAGRMMVSDDHGATWTPLASPLLDIGKYWYSYSIATSPTDPNNVYVLDAQHQKMYTSANQGASWNDVSANLPTGNNVGPNYNFSQADYDYHLECGSRVNGSKTSDVLYLGMIDIQESLDQGGTWQTIGGPTWAPLFAVSHNDQHALAVNPSNPNIALFSNDGGVYSLSYSPDTQHNTVTSLNKTLGNTTFYKIACHPTNPNIMIGGTQDDGSPFLNGDVAKWLNAAGGDGGGCIIGQANPLMGFVTAEHLRVWETTDGWATQSDISPPIGKSERRPFVSPLVENPGNPYILYTGTNLFYTWNDTQKLWYTGADLTHGEGVISAISYSVDGVLRAGSDDGVINEYNQTTGNWDFLPVPIDRAVTSIVTHPTKPADFLFGYSGTGVDHLYRYHNIAGSGFAFEDVSGSGASALPDASLNAIAWDLDTPDTTWYVATDVGVFQTSDAGKHWANIGAPYGLPNVIVHDLVAVPGTRYLNAGTYGRGMWRLYLPPNQPVLGGISLSPSSLVGGNNASATVTINAPAPAGGLTVLISGTSNLIVPSSITVPEGATQTMFQVLTNAVDANSTETIKATQHTVSATSSVILTPAQMSAVKVTPTIVISGSQATGEVDLNGGAPTSGYTVGLKCNVPGVVIPSSVTVLAGTVSATFPITTSSTQKKASVTITATKGATVQTTTFTVEPLALQGLTIYPSSNVGGSLTAVAGLITFNGASATGSVVVKLTSSSPASASVPASITVKPTANQLIFNFPITHFRVLANTTVKITASALGQKLIGTLLLTPFQVMSLTLNPTSVGGGAMSLGTVLLNATTDSKVGTLKILLSKTGAGISIPASVSIPAGQFSATFPIGTSIVKKDTQVPIQAKLGASSAKATVTVLSTQLVSLTVSPSTFVGGSSVNVVGTVTIGAPAPAGGVVINLMSYDTSGQLTVPHSVTIPSGKSSVSFTVTHHTVPIMEVVQIAAMVDGQSQTASVTVNP